MSGFPMNPVFECSDFGSLLYWLIGSVLQDVELCIIHECTRIVDINTLQPFEMSNCGLFLHTRVFLPLKYVNHVNES